MLILLFLLALIFYNGKFLYDKLKFPKTKSSKALLNNYVFLVFFNICLK